MKHQRHRDTEAQALWLLRFTNTIKRWKLPVTICVVATLSCGLIIPQFKLTDQTRVNAIEYYMARTKIWLAAGTLIRPNSTVTLSQTKLIVPSDKIVRDKYFQSTAARFKRVTLISALFGLALGILISMLLLQAIREDADEAFSDNIVSGTRLVSVKALYNMIAKQCCTDALRIGPVPIPQRLETRHFLFAGTTGSGKTTALRQALNGIEGRGEAAILFDSSREFIANYFDPARGDIILDPFDARCPIWSPFSEISHPADADRIAHQLVSETSERDDDVWLQTSRILVANMLRKLWAEGEHSLHSFLAALQVKTKDELREWLGETSSARTFADDADRATGSVLFMLSKAANLVQFLRVKGEGAQAFSFRKYVASLDNLEGPKPWIFVPRKEQYFEAAKPLIAAWLECASSAILSLTPSSNRRIWLILDELADLPKVENLARLFPEGRKFGACVAITFQSVGQMRARYGDRIAEAMMGCCNTKLFLQLSDQETRKWASATVGDCEIEIRNPTDNLTLDKDTARTAVSTLRQIRPAILESQFRLPAFEAYLLLPDGLPATRIKLSNEHISSENKPSQPGFVAGDINDTMWSHLTSIAPQPGAGPV
jgi:Type IV secretion-system coupling protein DNA-binding domain